MIRRLWLLPGAALCLAAMPGCTREDPRAVQDTDPAAARQFELEWQQIEVLVTVPSGNYRFEVEGRCGLDGQAIYAEGTSKNAEFSIHISKDADSGLVVFFSNRDDEWEIMLDPSSDTSSIDRKKIFRFAGDVPRNRDESDIEPLEMMLLCTGF